MSTITQFGGIDYETIMCDCKNGMICPMTAFANFTVKKDEKCRIYKKVVRPIPPTWDQALKNTEAITQENIQRVVLRSCYIDNESKLELLIVSDVGEEICYEINDDKCLTWLQQLAMQIRANRPLG